MMNSKTKASVFMSSKLRDYTGTSLEQMAYGKDDLEGVADWSPRRVNAGK